LASFQQIFTLTLLAPFPQNIPSATSTTTWTSTFRSAQLVKKAPPDPNRPAPEPGGIRAPYHVRVGYEWISRSTTADFGGQLYLLNIDAMPQDKGLRDLPLFHGMLAGFKYLG
jgi:hypothetical protein